MENNTPQPEKCSACEIYGKNPNANVLIGHASHCPLTGKSLISQPNRDWEDGAGELGDGSQRNHFYGKDDWQIRFEDKFFLKDEYGNPEMCIYRVNMNTDSVNKDVIDFIRQQKEESYREGVEEGQKIISLILPFAKGYVAKNEVGSNRKYIEIAEKFLYPTESESSIKSLLE